MKLDWNKIISNSVTVFVATVFVGAGTYLWTGVQSIDSRIKHQPLLHSGYTKNYCPKSR